MAGGDPCKTSVPEDEKPQKPVISDKQWAEELSTQNQPTQRGIIAAVPPMLKETTKDSDIYFEPRLVSLGPVHHNKLHLEPAQSVKLTAAQEFLKESESRSKEGKFKFNPDGCLDLLKRIKEETPQWRKQYEKHKGVNDYDNDELARMFLVDGCALLYFIHRQLQNKHFEIPGVKRHHVAIAFQDMFLLENQLPFELLELLMEYLHWSHGKSNSKTNLHNPLIDLDIERFIQGRILASPNNVTDDDHQAATLRHAEEWKPTHLLGLFRKRYITMSLNGNEDPPGPDLDKYLELAWKTLRDCLSKIAPECKLKSPHWLSFRRAVELSSRGIVFAPSESNILVDASLKPHYFWFFKKVLLLPPIILDDSSKSKFLNLIADEMSSNDPNESEVSNYLCFLDLLIDEPEDVKVLREANIIQNMLGSDKEAADLFNEITRDLVISHSIYQDIQKNLEEHCSAALVIHMAEFFHQHFSSPWTAIAFIAILLGLGLTMVQTYFTVNPRPQQCDGLCKFLEQVLHVPKMKID